MEIARSAAAAKKPGILWPARKQRQQFGRMYSGSNAKSIRGKGLTKAEKLDVRADLELRTLESGAVERETYRPVYLAVYEFMENGLLHSHIVIFGTTWIDSIQQISEDWDGNRAGFHGPCLCDDQKPG
jgi:hypothetical protein